MVDTSFVRNGIMLAVKGALGLAGTSKNKSCPRFVGGFSYFMGIFQVDGRDVDVTSDNQTTAKLFQWGGGCCSLRTVWK